MSYQVPTAPEAPVPPPETWSNIKVHQNGHFYISGLAGRGEGIYAQSRFVFDNMRRILEAAGGQMNDVMSLQIFVTDLNENTEVWRARREYFTGDFPCSTLVEVNRVGSPSAQPFARIEINCSGYIGGSR